MRLFQFLEEKVDKNYGFWDIGLLKTYGAIPGLIIGAYFPKQVISILPILIVIFIVLLLRYSYLLFIK